MGAGGVGGVGATLCGALARWGDPAALAADPDAAEELARLGGHYLTSEKVAALIESARASAGVRMGEWERREVKEMAAQVVERRREVCTCRRRLRRLAEGNAAVQAQAPALGLVTACVLWVSVGDPRGYGSAAAYRKAMGLNLVEQGSGKFKGQLHLSKRGQRLARKWMHFGALRWMRDPAVRPWVLAKKARDGGKGSRAVVAVMRKLAMAAWHVAVHGVAFDPKLLFPGGGGGRAKDEARAKAEAAVT